jgi:hypothetical protein
VCSNFTGWRKVEVQLLPFILLTGLHLVAPPLPSHTRGNRDTATSAGIFEQRARNQVGIGFSYRPAMLHRLAESISGLHRNLKIPPQRTCENKQAFSTIKLFVKSKREEIAKLKG